MKKAGLLRPAEVVKKLKSDIFVRQGICVAVAQRLYAVYQNPLAMWQYLLCRPKKVPRKAVQGGQLRWCTRYASLK